MKGEWLFEGSFVCGVGATGVYRRELDEEAVGRADMVVIESRAEAECGDLIYATLHGRLRWNQVIELKDVVSGRVRRSTDPGDDHRIR